MFCGCSGAEEGAGSEDGQLEEPIQALTSPTPAGGFSSAQMLHAVLITSAYLYCYLENLRILA